MADDYDKLILEIELPDFNADGMLGDARWAAEENGDNGDVAYELLRQVTEELMRPEVGLTMVTRPGEKQQNSDFEVHATTAQIVGARIRRAEGAPNG